MLERRKSKLAATSLILSLVGWIIYVLQWCFDLSIGLLLAAFTVGISTIFSTILDLIPFVLWLAGIVTGHIAVSQINSKREAGTNQAIGGLFLSYLGLFISIIFIAILIILIFAGVGVGLLYKIIPNFNK